MNSVADPVLASTANFFKRKMSIEETEWGYDFQSVSQPTFSCFLYPAIFFSGRTICAKHGVSAINQEQMLSEQTDELPKQLGPQCGLP